MNKIYTRKVSVDFDGNYTIEIPPELCEYLNLEFNDTIVWEMLEDKVIIRKRQDL